MGWRRIVEKATKENKNLKGKSGKIHAVTLINEYGIPQNVPPNCCKLKQNWINNTRCSDFIDDPELTDEDVTCKRCLIQLGRVQYG